ncbi:MAG: hypothetical protein WCL56_12955 [Sediminibacterium sp.]
MKNILLFILFVFSSTIIKAQDTLSMRSSENILVKIIEVGILEVKYKKIDNLNGPVFSILKSDLLMIKYENGTKDDFSSIKKIEGYNLFVIDDSVQGKNDAQRFYNGYKTAGNAVVATGYFLPLLIPALSISIATTTNVPKDENLNYPSKSLMQNEKYANSYRQEALKIKKRKVWLNFLITLPASIYMMMMLIYK